MTDLTTTLLPGAARLVSLHAAALPQKEALCGPFWGSLALRAAAPDADAAALDQDAVALAAGTTLLDRDEPEFRPAGAEPRVDYRLELPLTTEAEEAGTSVAGVVRAVELLSEGALAVVPVRGSWSPAALLSLFELLEALPAPVSAIANIATGGLWHSRATFATALRYLEDGVDEGPAAEWAVGHFFGLLGRVTGARGTLVLVADTYPELGSAGVHVQPLERLAAALDRVGTEQGGVLLAVRADAAAALAAAVPGSGLKVGVWDNGSPDAAEAGDAR